MIADPASGFRVVLLDIEGTTTPIAFVHETLFTFARKQLDEYLTQHWGDAAVQDVVRKLGVEHAAERDRPFAWNAAPDEEHRASVAKYVRFLMDRDRKSPGLKELQGLIWEDGYRAGELRGIVWDDVPVAMTRWRKAGLRIAIYSSGSERAQRLLFASTAQGDLTPMIAGFFDTRVGAKLDPESYGRIAAALGLAPDAVCFVSDVVGELRAAAAAGCRVVLSSRPGNPAQSGVDAFPVVTSFEQI